MFRRLSFFALVLILAASVGAAPLKHAVPQSPDSAVTPAPTGLIIVKFHEESGVKVLDDGTLTGPDTTRSRIADLVTTAARGARTARRFTRPAADLALERSKAESRTGLRLPDLTTYAEIDPGLGPDDRAGLERIVRELRNDPAVETAFLEPRTVPAALGFDAFTGKYTPPAYEDIVQVVSPDKITPDFTAQQGYRDNVQGVHALAVVGLAGADGSGVKVIDIEGAWKWDHEDLPVPFHESGGQYADQGWRDHGTAVMGEIRGSDNGIGVTGIAPACQVGCASIAGQSVPDALNVASANLDAGDVILIELHATGPNANGSGQFGYVAMEYWQDNFDAILMATAAGRIVVEAAGNGQQDFDDPVYGTLFDPMVRHSGAIMVGAGNAASNPEWFTNHGVRVDLNGWGSNVVTLGYGDLQGSPTYPETEWYTQYFGGTSSASPIVVGSVVSLQGLVKAQLSTVLDASLMRDMLHDYGTPQVVDPWLIGPRPNIDAAWTAVQAGIGTVSGTVTSAGSGLPVEGVLVHVQGGSRSTTTNAAGAYTLGMPVGGVTLEFSEYFHQDGIASLTISSGTTTTQDIALTSLPTVTLTGDVVSNLGLSTAGARVEPLGVPLSGTTAAVGGAWSIPGVPVGKTMSLLVDGVPYMGADFLTITPFDAGGGLYPVYPELRFTTQSFASPGGWTPLGAVWAHGTPTTGPAAAWSAGGCWGVGMDANYIDGAAGSLESPNYTFWTGDQLHLSFHYWSGTEAGWDGVVLRIQDGVDWTILQPLIGYTHVSLPGLNNSPGWSGDSGGWTGTVFDLTTWIGQPIKLSFLFGADDYVNDVGFFLDDVTFDDGDQVVAVDDLGPVRAGGPEVSSHPNPFNPSTNVRWRVETPGRLAIDIHDARGRMVRSLFQGESASTSGVIRWDGRDDAGRSLPSGPYLVRVRDAAGRTSSSRTTLLK